MNRFHRTIMTIFLVTGWVAGMLLILAGCASTPQEQCETLKCTKKHAAHEAGAIARARCYAWYAVEERKLGIGRNEIIYPKCGNKHQCCMAVAQKVMRETMK